MVALALTMLLASYTFAQGQTQNEPRTRTSRWTIGPKAGINLTQFWGNDFNNDFANPRLSGQFGGFFTWSNDRWFAISGELLYSAKGTRYKYDLPFIGSAKSVTRMDYIEMPLLFRVFFVQSGAVRPHASIGPSLGFLVVAHSKGIDPESDAESFRDDAHVFDVGLNIGSGVNIRTGPIWINPELRYNLGLINIGDDYSARNGAFTFSVAVGIPIGTNK